MPTQVALFRGINVGGKNTLPMRELAEDLQSLGCLDVQTYIQSGNAVFKCTTKTAASLGKNIAKKIKHRYGFTPEVLILTAQKLQKAVASNPFPDAEDDPKTLHLSFLTEKPPAPNLEALNDLKSTTEQFELKGDVFYLSAPDGIGRSKLAAKVEKLLAVPATGRNWRTVTTLAQMAKDA